MEKKKVKAACFCLSLSTSGCVCGAITGIIFKVALHVTEVYSAAQKQQNPPTRGAKQAHTGDILNKSSTFFYYYFFYQRVQICAAANLSNVPRDGLYDARCLSGELCSRAACVSL